MSVSLDEVRRIAALARLELSEERARSLVTDLNGILEHMDVLSTVDTTGGTAVSGIGAEGTPLRLDGGAPVPLARPLTDMAPAMRDGFFLVPRLATHDNMDSA